LSVFLVGIGGAVGARDGIFNLPRFLLCMAGIVFAHCAVNLFNEHSDFKTGIDFHTLRTPFSGGSGNLPALALSPSSVLKAAILMLSLAFVIGIYLTFVAGWMVLAFMIAGGIAIVFYTPVLARFGFGEVFAGMCLGSFVVMGTYYAFTGHLTQNVAWLSVSPGVFTTLLLFLNEFPDAKADKDGGRRHWVILLGWKGATILYAALSIVSFGIMAAGVALHWFPKTLLLALLTLPLCILATVLTLRAAGDGKKMVPALGLNVCMILVSDILIAVAYLI
jgi:1,4-dihydroxy-2-naphthoate octaprenyltransferase